jgi:hypothetical protein
VIYHRIELHRFSRVEPESSVNCFLSGNKVFSNKLTLTCPECIRDNIFLLDMGNKASPFSRLFLYSLLEFLMLTLDAV